MRPLVRRFARLDVQGFEHVRDVAAPYLVVANHRSNLDTVLLKTVLPDPAASRLAPAMTTRVHAAYFGEKPGSPLRVAREWMEVRLAQLLMHAWPISDTGDFLASLSYAGELADAGYSLLIFPEGRIVPEGEIAKFREGIGLFARELRMPVVPAYLEGTAVVLPDGAGWPRPGQLRVVFGPGLEIEPDSEPAEATRQIEAAVRALAPRGVRGPEREPPAEEPSPEPELVGHR